MAICWLQSPLLDLGPVLYSAFLQIPRGPTPHSEPGPFGLGPTSLLACLNMLGSCSPELELLKGK